MRLLHEAKRRLYPQMRAAAVIGASRLIAAILCLICGYAVQNRLGVLVSPHAAYASAPTLWDIFVPGAILFTLIALTPLRVQTDWQIGRIGGTLDKNDLGFLEQCGSIWLWLRALHTGMLMRLALIFSAMPSLVLAVLAKAVWLLIPPESEGILPLLTVLHLALLAAAALLLPLRLCAAATAVPFCFLREPYLPARKILRNALTLTAHRSGGILRVRLLSLPAILFPFTGVIALPLLLCTEQLRCCHAVRQRQPVGTSRFSRMELHACEQASV